jgi:hypothetical protein
MQCDTTTKASAAEASIAYITFQFQFIVTPHRFPQYEGLRLLVDLWCLVATIAGK